MKTLLERSTEIWRQAAQRYTNHKNIRARNVAILEQRGDYSEAEEPERMIKRLQLKGNTSSMSAHMVKEAMADPASSYLFLERIIADSQLQNVSFLLDGAQKSRTVGRVVIRSESGTVLGYGTGFLISPKLLMTNNHVLDSAYTAEYSTVQFDYYKPAKGNPSKLSEFTFTPEIFFYTNSLLDFTIVSVTSENDSGEILEKRGWNMLIPESGKALIGERVNIIQHPGGEHLQIAIRENPIIDRLDRFLHYQTDTLPGSSGSPVYNDQWDLIALHHSAVPEMDVQKRFLLKNGSVWNGRKDTMNQINWVANEGVRISSIVAYMESLNLSPSEHTLFNDAFTEPPTHVVGDSHEHSPYGVGSTISDAFFTRENNDTASWYFRLNFGPADVVSSSGANVRQVTATTPLPVQPARTAQKKIDKKPFESIAYSIFELNTHPDIAYYDTMEDATKKEAYYKDFNAALRRVNSSQQAFRELHELIKSHKNYGYTKARWSYLYPWVDRHEDGSLQNVYSGELLDPVEILRREIETICRIAPQLVNESNTLESERLEALYNALDQEHLTDLLEAQHPFNCEHVVPQSWFSKQNPMKSDMHHLFTCEPNCNSFRSNIPYFDFDPVEEAERSNCGKRIKDKFEPHYGHGAVARATLYFLVRYPGMIGDEHRELQKERLKLIINWHKVHKVSPYEHHRNMCIALAQGNRNPFIDYPDLVDNIDLNLGFA